MSVEGLIAQFQMTNRVLRANVGDVTHEESLIQPKPAGNCLNWVLGHMVATRSAFITGLGGQPVWSEAERKPYDRHEGPLTNKSSAKPLAEIWAALDETLASIH